MASALPSHERLPADECGPIHVSHCQNVFCFALWYVYEHVCGGDTSTRPPRFLVECLTQRISDFARMCLPVSIVFSWFGVVCILFSRHTRDSLRRLQHTNDCRFSWRDEAAVCSSPVRTRCDRIACACDITCFLWIYWCSCMWPRSKALA